MELFGPWQDSYSGGYNFDLNFGAGNGLATGGTVESTQRANDSFFGFDQSKISASVFDVMNSLGTTVMNTAGKAAGKALGDAISPPADSQNQFLRNFFTSFSGTKTGQQVQNQAIMGNIAGIFSSPIVWVVSIAGIVAILLLRK